MRLRTAVAWAGVGLVVLLAASCSSSPSGPGPVVQPPPNNTPPPPPNALPVIDAMTAQGRRPKEPASFADLGETIDLAARVSDAETAPADLEYAWTATAGIIEGTGAKVTWRAPDAFATPADVRITLKVTERFGYPGEAKSYSQDVSSTAVVSLHNSTKELGEMARQFLLDFSDSSIRDVPSIMRNFIPGCYGTQEETNQVTENRRRYKILESSVGDAQTTVNFGGTCPYGAKRGDACTAVPVYWKSIDLDRNAIEAVRGTDWLASFYVPATRRWGLCDSSFQGRPGAAPTDFIR